MKILIACEFSGVVRRAFRELGHDVWSCDLLPAEDGSEFHFQGDIFTFLNISRNWDMMIAFPPCTNLCVSGARWFKAKQLSGEQQRSIDFFLALERTPVNKIAIENPIGIMSTHYRKPDQIIHPWQFGHGETKATCLWLKNLPKLIPTHIVSGRVARVHRLPPSKDRWKLRSVTYAGIALAMSLQWPDLAAYDGV